MAGRHDRHAVGQDIRLVHEVCGEDDGSPGPVAKEAEDKTEARKVATYAEEEATRVAIEAKEAAEAEEAKDQAEAMKVAT